jgi:hypothetical protein
MAVKPKKTAAKKTATGKTATPKQSAKGGFDRTMIATITTAKNNFLKHHDISESLTGTQRRRLFSAGVRNYGFIDKAADIAIDNQTFMPPNFDVDNLFYNIRELEDLRQLMLVLQQFEQIVSNAFMLQADICYRDALRIYGSLREQSRNRVPGAQELFDALRTFFAKRRRIGTEPTEKELELDLKKLIHGKADGEIFIKNESPQISGGIHEIIDHVHTGRSAFKETEQAVVNDGASPRPTIRKK